MSKRPDPYASEADTLALIRKDTRTEAEKYLDKMLDERGASEQGAEAGVILRQIALELLAMKPLPNLKPCHCRWNGDVLVQQCTLHEAHVDAIHEWAERAKTAEQRLKQAQRKPLTDQQIQDLRHMIDWTASWSYIEFARAIEKAHGIEGGA